MGVVWSVARRRPGRRTGRAALIRGRQRYPDWRQSGASGPIHGRARGAPGAACFRLGTSRSGPPFRRRALSLRIRPGRTRASFSWWSPTTGSMCLCRGGGPRSPQSRWRRRGATSRCWPGAGARSCGSTWGPTWSPRSTAATIWSRKPRNGASVWCPPLPPAAGEAGLGRPQRLALGSRTGPASVWWRGERFRSSPLLMTPCASLWKPFCGFQGPMGAFGASTGQAAQRLAATRIGRLSGAAGCRTAPQ